VVFVAPVADTDVVVVVVGIPRAVTSPVIVTPETVAELDTVTGVGVAADDDERPPVEVECDDQFAASTSQANITAPDASALANRRIARKRRLEIASRPLMTSAPSHAPPPAFSAIGKLLRPTLLVSRAGPTRNARRRLTNAAHRRQSGSVRPIEPNVRRVARL